MEGVVIVRVSLYTISGGRKILPRSDGSLVTGKIKRKQIAHKRLFKLIVGDLPISFFLRFLRGRKPRFLRKLLLTRTCVDIYFLRVNVYRAVHNKQTKTLFGMIDGVA